MSEPTTPRHRRGIAALGAVAMLAGPLAYLTTPSGASAPVTSRSIVQAQLTEALNISASDTSHVEITTLNVKPGTSTIWHSHARPVLVSVKQGTASVYRADGSGCTRHEKPTGTAFVENAGQVHAVRNEGSELLVLYVVFVVPQGGSLGAAEVAPAQCTFAPLS